MSEKRPEAPDLTRSERLDQGRVTSVATEKDGDRVTRPATPKRVEIVLRIEPAEPERRSDAGDDKPEPGAGSPAGRQDACPTTLRAEAGGTRGPTTAEVQQIPARMLNEFVYCQRLFYYEFVEGVFVESADTLRGSAIHKRVDSGSGALPKAAKSKAQTPKSKVDSGAAVPAASSGASPVLAGETPAPLPSSQTGETAPEGSEQTSGVGDQTVAAGTDCPTSETIHSRSVQMGSDRLGVVAKMDLVESTVQSLTSASPQAPHPQPLSHHMGEGGHRPGEGQQSDFTDALFTALEVCPVDYKAGAPKEGADANELWDTDKMQLGLQALILRDNGYTCNEGVIYYRATKQRVRLPITPELESWILQNIAEARRVVTGPIPAPLVNSPKCVRCSLAPVCLPDETRMLKRVESENELRVESVQGEGTEANQGD